ncbi:hypothetical protein JCM19237_5533 [Photobacterium aphoticum]|uniref:Uncharacterized protein n=1 Tax=Photobacterium aphoticum TaxID=754436 RepID=A0A090QHL9_9GAMM|nr:hypothetical protein JCM19237_5533 [Photobacterium aphoticum]
MENKDTVKILSEIRDEMKEMNAQIKWLTNKAIKAMEDDENENRDAMERVNQDNKKSKFELYLFILISIALFVLYFFDFI